MRVAPSSAKQVLNCLQFKTFYQGIKEVDFATYLIIDSKLNKKEYKYWSLKDEINSDISFKDIVNQTKELLIKSVELRLRSDVPLAFCLSGGIDSCAIASKIKNTL